MQHLSKVLLALALFVAISLAQFPDNCEVGDTVCLEYKDIAGQVHKNCSIIETCVHGSDLLDVRRSVDSAKKEEDSLIEKMVDEALVPPKPFKK